MDDRRQDSTETTTGDSSATKLLHHPSGLSWGSPPFRLTAEERRDWNREIIENWYRTALTPVHRPSIIIFATSVFPITWYYISLGCCCFSSGMCDRWFRVSGWWLVDFGRIHYYYVDNLNMTLFYQQIDICSTYKWHNLSPSISSNMGSCNFIPLRGHLSRRWWSQVVDYDDHCWIIVVVSLAVCRMSVFLSIFHWFCSASTLISTTRGVCGLILDF